ncbi:MAG: NAD(P)/FAD-dependent oxidoreductase [Limisphaerales bacterium]
MKDSVFWFEQKQVEPTAPLSGSIECDAVVIGGGMAGLSTAQWLREEAGLDVVVIEAKICGSGASGISSGLMNPDTELDTHQLTRRFGDEEGKFLWDAAFEGIQQVRRNIDRFKIDCGYIPADSLYVADSRLGTPEVKKEHRTRLRLGLESHFYQRKELSSVLGTDRFHAAVRFGGTFGMSALHYLQGLRDSLVKLGVRIYENSPATAIHPHEVTTGMGKVKAKHVFACLDRFGPSMGILPNNSYQQQNFIVVSEPIDPEILGSIFPAGPMLVYDEHAVYHYFRPTPDGRLILGGGLSRNAYDRKEAVPFKAGEYLKKFIRKKFPLLEQVQFTHVWPGFLGISRDLLPIAGRCFQKQESDPIYVAMCAGGMTWSLLAAQTAARIAVEGKSPFERFFAPDRSFTPIDPLTRLLPKPTSFEFSHLYTKTLLKGMPDRIARQQQWVRRTIWTLAATSAVGTLWWLQTKRRKT